MIYTYQYNGATYSVSLEPRPDGTFRVAVGERAYTVWPQRAPGGGWLLALDGKTTLVYTAARGGERHVNVGGQAYAFTTPDARPSRRRQAAGGSGGALLTAQMPGQVMDVRAAEGDQVEKGQTLVILEAMKMEIRVAAPQAGRVRRLLVSKGQMVERGQLLLEVESSEC